MKFTAAFFLAVAATVSAQDAERRSIKEQLMEHRRDMFQHRADHTLEAIKDNHVRRMAKLEEMIEERRVMVEEHESGRRLLSDSEYERAARQHKNFQRKLEQMKTHNHDAAHLEKLEELKSLHSEHRLDYLNFRDDIGKP